MSKFKTTTSFKKIASLNKPIRIIQGGKGAGKTIAILMYFIYLAISKRENLILSVVAESLPNLKSGALRDFEKILKDMGLYSKFKINNTDRTYKFGSNTIEFFSIQGEASRLGSRRTHLYINEASQITLESYIELQGRTSELTLLDYNPRKKFFVHTELKDEPNVDFIILNYLDNEYIPQNELDSIMWYKKKAEQGNPYWINKWKVLGLGELGVAEGLIFERGKGWDVIDQLPKGAKYLGAGCDFGFSHVTAIVKLYQWNNKVILKESLFKPHYTAPRIATHILRDREQLTSVIPADSSRPEMIREIRAKGIPMISHKKGDVLSGLDLMHSHDLLITADSTNLIEEFESYEYAKDKNGQSLGVPNKAQDNDNGIDASRYAMEYFLGAGNNHTNQLRWVS